MQKVYVVLLMIMASVCELSASAAIVVKKALSAEDALELKKVRSFNAEFVAWKKKLSNAQIHHFEELFGLYDQLYRSYKARPDSAHEYTLITTMVQSLKNIMENWDSFYRDYIEVQIFAKKVQTWKIGLTPEQKAKVKTALSIYATLYDRYEVEPTNAKFLADVLQEQKSIQKLMEK